MAIQANPEKSIFSFVFVISFGRNFSPIKIVTSPTGTLIQKIYDQEKFDKINPPIPGPAIAPKETKAPTAPSARPLSFKGNTYVIIPELVAMVMLAPIL